MAELPHLMWNRWGVWGQVEPFRLKDAGVCQRASPSPGDDGRPTPSQDDKSRSR